MAVKLCIMSCVYGSKSITFHFHVSVSNVKYNYIDVYTI